MASIEIKHYRCACCGTEYVELINIIDRHITCPECLTYNREIRSSTFKTNKNIFKKILSTSGTSYAMYNTVTPASIGSKVTLNR